MTKLYRRMGAIAVGALVAPPLISLLASPLASADPTDAALAGDLSYTLGPDTLTVNLSDFAFDNYISTPNVDVDLYDDGGLTSKTYDVVITDPKLFQLTIGDDDGTITHTLVTNPADFTSTDPGLAGLGGASPDATAAAAAALVTTTDLQYSLGPDTLTINPSDFAFDNYIATSNFDIDIYNAGGLTSNIYDAVITDPGKFQLDITDVGGTITHELLTSGFGATDPGLADIGGTVATDVAGGGLLESLAGLFGL